MLKIKEISTKSPCASWIEGGKLYLNMACTIAPTTRYWITCAGEVFVYDCETGEYHLLVPYPVKEYLTVKINGQNYLVSRLVATYFVHRPAGTTDVHHKDGNKLNNRYTNLVWLTHEEHMEIHHGKAVVMLDPCTYKLLATFPSAKVAAEATNIPATSIRSCTNHQTKTSHGYIWVKAAEYFHTENVA